MARDFAWFFERRCRFLFVACVLVIGCFSIWRASHSPPRVRVRFVGIVPQKFPTPGTVKAMFQLENELNENLRGIDLYLQGNNHSLDSVNPIIQEEPDGVTVGTMPVFPSVSTNIFTCLVPANAGPYRLCLAYCPSDRFPRESISSFRWRLANRLYRFLPRKYSTEPVAPGITKTFYRIQGWSWTFTEPFQPIQTKSSQ